jgi:hypothetical protein
LNFVTVVVNDERVRFNGRVHRGFMLAHVQGRAQSKLDGFGAGRNAIVDEGSVLTMGQIDALFKRHAVYFVGPDGQPGIKLKIGQIGRARERVLFRVQPVEWNRATVREDEFLEQIVQHHRAPQRGRQSGNQVAVKHTRGCSADGSAGITAQTVGDEPLGFEKVARILLS